MTQPRKHAGQIDVPWNLVIPEADLYLVGYGMRLPNDLTLETLAVLKSCTRVFGIPPLHAPEFGIPPMENLTLHYAADKNRRATYREWQDLVLTAAESDPPVALATYGSPVVGTLITHQLLEQAPHRGLTVHVTNAVSFLDGIWADLNIEPFFGFEIWEASYLVRMGIEPNTHTNLCLPQAPMFGVTTGIDTTTMTTPASSTTYQLRDYLLQFYPPEHEVTLIKTGSGTGTQSLGTALDTLPLADLDHPGHDRASTLIVPRRTPHTTLDFTRPRHTATTAD